MSPWAQRSEETSVGWEQTAEGPGEGPGRLQAWRSCRPGRSSHTAPTARSRLQRGRRARLNGRTPARGRAATVSGAPLPPSLSLRPFLHCSSRNLGELVAWAQDTARRTPDAQHLGPRTDSCGRGSQLSEASGTTATEGHSPDRVHSSPGAHAGIRNGHGERPGPSLPGPFSLLPSSPLCRPRLRAPSPEARPLSGPARALCRPWDHARHAGLRRRRRRGAGRPTRCGPACLPCLEPPDRSENRLRSQTAEESTLQLFSLFFNLQNMLLRIRTGGVARSTADAGARCRAARGLDGAALARAIADGRPGTGDTPAAPRSSRTARESPGPLPAERASAAAPASAPGLAV